MKLLPALFSILFYACSSISAQSIPHGTNQHSLQLKYKAGDKVPPVPDLQSYHFLGSNSFGIYYFTLDLMGNNIMGGTEVREIMVDAFDKSLHKQKSFKLDNFVYTKAKITSKYKYILDFYELSQRFYAVYLVKDKDSKKIIYYIEEIDLEKGKMTGNAKKLFSFDGSSGYDAFSMGLVINNSTHEFLVYRKVEGDKRSFRFYYFDTSFTKVYDTQLDVKKYTRLGMDNLQNYLPYEQNTHLIIIDQDRNFCFLETTQEMYWGDIYTPYYDCYLTKYNHSNSASYTNKVMEIPYEQVYPFLYLNHSNKAECALLYSAKAEFGMYIYEINETGKVKEAGHTKFNETDIDAKTWTASQSQSKIMNGLQIREVFDEGTSIKYIILEYFHMSKEAVTYSDAFVLKLENNEVTLITKISKHSNIGAMLINNNANEIAFLYRDNNSSSDATLSFYNKSNSGAETCRIKKEVNINPLSASFPAPGVINGIGRYEGETSILSIEKKE
jgi:hypothetical protein